MMVDGLIQVSDPIHKDLSNNIIFSKLYNFAMWLQDYDSLVELSYFEKFAFIGSNIIYFIPIILFGINIVNIIIIIIGIVSSSFHTCQCCYPCPHKLTRTLLWCDVLYVIPATLAIIFICHNLLPNSWYFTWLLVVPIFILGDPSLGKRLYILLHGMWHLLSAGLMFYAAKVYHDDSVKKKKPIKGILKKSTHISTDSTPETF
jgi:hypothetical protein